MSFRTRNTMLLLGTIIGAGIFSLPVALKHAGLFIFVVLLLVLGFFMGKINIFYREIIDSYDQKHQLPGYIKLVLGKKTSVIALFLQLFSLFGALLAYLILAGEFSSGALGIDKTNGTYVTYFIAVLILFIGGKLMENLDVLFSFLKLILLSIVVLVGFSLFDVRIIAGLMRFKGDIIIAYGSILFAFTGFSLMPELKKDKQIPLSVFAAMGVSGFLYLFFALSLVGLVQNSFFAFPAGWPRVLFGLAGLLAVFTPYLLLSWVVYDTFKRDLNINRTTSLFLTIIVPFALFLGGIHNFAEVIAVTGGVFLGGIAILIVRMYQKKFPGKDTAFTWLLQGIFLLGIVAEIFGFIYKLTS